jgi:hypothetical protein
LKVLEAVEEALPILQGDGNMGRTVNADCNVGFDSTTEMPTVIYTVITDGHNQLVTMFPGL